MVYKTRFKKNANEDHEFGPNIVAENLDQAKVLFSHLKKQYPSLEMLGEVKETNESSKKNENLLLG
jgi:hypothetical protein